jgi:prepilin-type N-terminal cleavage/methylation domain-containing protein
MLNKIKKDNKGFTIIEVLIVLAIAGLILLVVFLAVPALQRNSRNTQLRSAANTIAGGINEYIANNNGTLPGNPGFTIANGEATIGGSNIVKVPGSIASTDITYNKDKKCNSTGTGVDPNTANRSFALTFSVETGGASTTPQCING